jgi:capsid protein
VGIFDKALGKVRMGLAKSLGYVPPKMTASAYEGASQGRRHSSWLGTQASINSMLGASGDMLRARSHESIINNPYASNAIETLVTNLIGTGLRPKCKAEDKEFRQAAQKLWKHWEKEWVLKLALSNPN